MRFMRCVFMVLELPKVFPSRRRTSLSTRRYRLQMRCWQLKRKLNQSWSRLLNLFHFGTSFHHLKRRTHKMPTILFNAVFSLQSSFAKWQSKMKVSSWMPWMTSSTEKSDTSTDTTTANTQESTTKPQATDSKESKS